GVGRAQERALLTGPPAAALLQVLGGCAFPLRRGGRGGHVFSLRYSSSKKGQDRGSCPVRRCVLRCARSGSVLLGHVPLVLAPTWGLQPLQLHLVCGPKQAGQL